MKIWDSSLLVNLLVGESVRLSDLSLEGENLYWSESRPSEKGRCTIMCQNKSGEKIDLLPQDYSAKSKLHVYGGKAYSLSNEEICFINKHDSGIYLREQSDEIIPLIIDENAVYGGLNYYANEKLLFGIREVVNHNNQKTSEVFVYDLTTQENTTLHDKYDFYANVEYNPSNNRLAFVSWDDPAMPWDENLLSVAHYRDRKLEDITTISPLSGVSIFQPKWHPSGELLYVSNENGWGNLYAWDGDTHRCLYKRNAEFSLPLWITGMSTYGIDERGEIWATGKENGQWKLFQISPNNQKTQEIALKSKSLLSIAVAQNEVAFIGASDSELPSIQRFNTRTRVTSQVQKSSPFTASKSYLPKVESIYFPTHDDLMVQAWYYPATNPDYSHQSGEAPLIVIAHSGPTAAADCELDPRYLFWTSRGFSILDVNYRGSTGFGKKYQDDLRGQWGIIDRLDCESAASYAVEKGWAHPNKLIIRGSSAGGFTALSCLTFGNVFAVGASYYGVSDLLALANETHRFEAYYSDHLVGKLPASEKVYKERSPAYQIEKLNKPIAFFQGEEDEVVPPSQSEIMHQALLAKNIPTIYKLFPGEGHGFRQLKTIKTCLEEELKFYQSILT